MTHDNPPLTAEGIMEKHALCCDTSLSHLDRLVVDDINKLVAQQTAAKDARIAELERKLADLESRYRVSCTKMAKFRRWYDSAQRAKKLLMGGNIEKAMKCLPNPEHVKGGL